MSGPPGSRACKSRRRRRQPWQAHREQDGVWPQVCSERAGRQEGEGLGERKGTGRENWGGKPGWEGTCHWEGLAPALLQTLLVLVPRLASGQQWLRPRPFTCPVTPAPKAGPGGHHPPCRCRPGQAGQKPLLLKDPALLGLCSCFVGSVLRGMPPASRAGGPGIAQLGLPKAPCCHSRRPPPRPQPLLLTELFSGCWLCADLSPTKPLMISPGISATNPWHTLPRTLTVSLWFRFVRGSIKPSL